MQNGGEVPIFSGTISDAEHRIERVLDQLKAVTSRTSPAEGLAIALSVKAAFSPLGFRSKVQLEEDGRKKRSTADATNFRFATGEIVVMFEPDEEGGKAGTESAGLATNVGSSLQETAKYAFDAGVPSDIESNALQSSTALEIDQFCEALSRTEQDSSSFVSVKRFRDLILPAYSFAWCKSHGGPQRVLSAAVAAGRVVVSKIPNPKNPSFPTSCINTSRASAATPSASRFNPIPVRGEPASVTLLRDRG